MVQRIHHIIHSGIWHSAPLKDLQPFLRCALPRLRLDQRFQDGTVLNPCIVGGEAWVLSPGWLAEFLAEDAEESVVSAADEDGAVGGGEALVGDDRG